MGHLGRAPGTGLDRGSSKSPRVSVDQDADAISVRLGFGPSVDQVVRIAAVAFDAADRLVGLTIRMEI